MRVGSFCSSISDPLGHPLGSLWAPNWLPRWPQEPPRQPQDGSKTLQDASKPAPGALQDPSSNAKELSRAAKRRPRAPRDSPGIDFNHPRGRLGVDLDPPGGLDQGSYSLGRRDPRTRIQSAAHLPVCFSVLNPRYLTTCSGPRELNPFRDAPPPSLGPPLGAALPSRSAHGHARPSPFMRTFRPRRLQERSRCLQDAPRALQEAQDASKSAKMPPEQASGPRKYQDFH